MSVRDRRHCGECHAMVRDGDPEKGACPTGGGHEAVGHMLVLSRLADRRAPVPTDRIQRIA